MQKITFALLAVIVLNVRPPCPARDLPQGAQVRHGRIDIHTSDHAMLIEQHSAKAIVDWDSFDIGPGFGVDLQQPSSQATMLARVIGGVPSEICGRLTANGGFYLVNPAGILFANGATVDVNRLLATTQNITDEAFLANRLEFAGTGHADVVNCGSLSAEMVALIAQKVENHGEIAAPQSALIGGTAIRLHQFDNGGTLRIDFSKLDLNYCSTVINKGNIQADNGTAVLTAGGGAGLIEANEGTVVARSAEFSGRNAALSRLGNISAEEIVIDPTANLVIGPATAQSSGLGYGLTAQTVGAGEIEISAEAAQPEFTAGIGYGFHDQNGNGWTYLRREANTLGGVLDSYSYLDPVLTYYHDAYLNTQLNQQAITLQYNRHGTTDGAIAVAAGATLGGTHPLTLLAESDLTLANGVSAPNPTALTFQAGHNLALESLDSPAAITLTAGNNLHCGEIRGRALALTAGQELTLTNGATATNESVFAAGETMRINGEVIANQEIEFNFCHLVSTGDVTLGAPQKVQIQGDWLANHRNLALTTTGGDLEIHGAIREAEELNLTGGTSVKLDKSSLLQSDYINIKSSGILLSQGTILATKDVSASADGPLLSSGTIVSPQAAFQGGSDMNISATASSHVPELLVASHGDGAEVQLDWANVLARLELTTQGNHSIGTAKVGIVESGTLLAEGNGSSLALDGSEIRLERAETASGDLMVTGSRSLTLGGAQSRTSGDVSVTSGADLVVEELLASAGHLEATAGGRVVLAGQDRLVAGGNILLAAADFGQARTVFPIDAGGKLYLAAVPGSGKTTLFARLEGPTRDHAIHPRGRKLPGVVIFNGRAWMGTSEQMTAIGRAESELFSRVCAMLRNEK